MLKSLRLPLENKKYAYIEVKAIYNERHIEVHIIDRINPKSGVSIIECIEEIQELIINSLGAKDFAIKLLTKSKWFLYGKQGKVAQYQTIEGVQLLQPYDPRLDKEMVELAMERTAIIAPAPKKAKKSSKRASGRNVSKTSGKKAASKSKVVAFPVIEETTQLSLF